MDVKEAIRSRRAIRSYAPRKVDDDTVRALIDAAIQAPSAMNAQPWVFGVVQDTARLARWSERAKAMMLEQAGGDTKTQRYVELLGNPSFNIFYDASTLIVIGVEKRGMYTDADCWLAAENLMLAACDVGLGTCCIGFAIPLLNTPEVKHEIGLPQAGVAVAAIIVGYPTATPPPVTRNEPQILCWIR